MSQTHSKDRETMECNNEAIPKDGGMNQAGHFLSSLEIFVIHATFSLTISAYNNLKSKLIPQAMGETTS